MNAMKRAEKERQNAARSRAGRIRYAMTVIADAYDAMVEARAEGDHLTLGYESWEAYVDGEFGEHRVKLAPERRAVAVAAFAAVGLTQRETAYTLGVSPATVNRALASGVSNETRAEEEGAGQRVSDALKQAIVDAGERAEDHRDSSSPGEAEPVRGVATEPGAAAGAGACDPAPAPNSPSEVQRPDEPAGTGESTENAGTSAAPDVPAPEHPVDATSVPGDPEPASPPAGEGEQGGPATSPAGPPCEKCGGEMEPGAYDEDFRQCVGCDPNGAHVADGGGRCLLCADLDALIESVPAAYVPLQIAAGADGLFLRCGHCVAVVAPLKPGQPLAVALIEADQHAENCPGSTA